MSWNSNRMSRGATEDALDRENQQRSEVLSGKVARLKSLAFDIEMETKDQNKMLDNMDGDFDSTTGLLSGSMKRIGNMVASGKNNRKIICYMIVFALIAFFLIYFILSWVRR